ncbi:MAG TPA: LLM class flavin-dependent oxidoreductase, partial [Halioglobus sp.]
MVDPVSAAALAAEIEKAGFDGAYTFEGKSDPFISLAAVAMRTERLE